jgi:hypothetical protein
MDYSNRDKYPAFFAFFEGIDFNYLNSKLFPFEMDSLKNFVPLQTTQPCDSTPEKETKAASRSFNSSSSLFKSKKQHKQIDKSEDVSAEEMANSAFGQSSFTADPFRLNQ